MVLKIRLVLDTDKDANALRVVSRLNKVIDAGEPKLERYHKGGTIVQIAKTVNHIKWSDIVLETLSLAQSFGRGWEMLGSIEYEVNLVGRSFSVPGITWAELRIERPNRNSHTDEINPANEPDARLLSKNQEDRPLKR
ncbi:MAG: hypothetical protein AAFV59_16665 [Pseudomonadota bacterium]